MSFLTLREAYLKEKVSNKHETKTLYYIGPHPAKPVPYRSWKGDDLESGWYRPWLPGRITKEPVVFMSDNWKGVMHNHGIRGNVYAYKIPKAAIVKSHGLHRYDWAREIIIPKSVWNEFNLSNTMIGKVHNRKEAENIALQPVESRFQSMFGITDPYADKKQKELPIKTLKLDPKKAAEVLSLYPKKEREELLSLMAQKVNEYKKALEMKYRDVPKDSYGLRMSYNKRADAPQIIKNWIELQQILAKKK